MHEEKAWMEVVPVLWMWGAVPGEHIHFPVTHGPCRTTKYDNMYTYTKYINITDVDYIQLA